MSKAQPNFSSDGFDLDAMAAAEGGEGETVFEIGGSATTVPSAPNAGASSDAAADAGPATASAEPDLADQWCPRPTWRCIIALGS